MTTPTRSGNAAPPEIGLSNASYLQMGLEALQAQDIPRAVGALASIDADAWQAITARFPQLPALLAANTGGAQ